MTRLVIQFMLQKGWINDHYYYYLLLKVDDGEWRLLLSLYLRFFANFIVHNYGIVVHLE